MTNIIIYLSTLENVVAKYKCYISGNNKLTLIAIKILFPERIDNNKNEQEEGAVSDATQLKIVSISVISKQRFVSS